MNFDFLTKVKIIQTKCKDDLTHLNAYAPWIISEKSLTPALVNLNKINSAT